MKAIVLSIGSELLRGDIVDTNAAFLTRELSRLGFDVVRVEQVGDHLEQLTSVFAAALGAADITLSTGGLGPTQDDLTREAVARVLGEEMFSDAALVAQVEARFATLRRRMPESNFRQALRIPSAEAMPNPHGTAPGWFVLAAKRVIATMPGPPAEMEPMWRDEVRPRLESRVAGSILDRTIMTFGLGESTVEHRIADIIGSRPEVTVATYAKSAGVEVHLTARAENEGRATTLIDQTEGDVRVRLGTAIFAVGNVTLGEIVADLLAERGLTIAVMESATGGELANMITNHPGSSDYFVGGIIAYAREIKEAFGVPAELCDRYGLISPQVAVAMACAVRARLGSDIGVGVTGIAGTESVEGKPPGTCFIAVSMEGTEDVREIHRPATRTVAKRFFAQYALDLLRRRLIGAEVATE